MYIHCNFTQHFRCHKYFTLYNNILLHLDCDYTSSFFGKGKAKALKLARSNEHFVQTFSELGSMEEADHKAWNTLGKCTCSLFGDSEAQTVNDARYNLFTQGKFGICQFWYIWYLIDASQ